MSPDIARCPLGAQSSPVESHWTRFIFKSQIYTVVLTNKRLLQKDKDSSMPVTWFSVCKTVVKWLMDKFTCSNKNVRGNSTTNFRIEATSRERRNKNEWRYIYDILHFRKRSEANKPRYYQLKSEKAVQFLCIFTQSACLNSCGISCNIIAHFNICQEC